MIDRVKGSNKNDCPPVEYSRYSTDGESPQVEYMHILEQIEGPRRQSQIGPPVQQLKNSPLLPVDARKSGGHAHGFPMGRRAVGMYRTHGTAVAGSNKTDLDKKDSTHKKEMNCYTSWLTLAHP